MTNLPSAPPVFGLAEVVLEVTDLAAAEQFYAEALGLPVVDRWQDEEPMVSFRLGRSLRELWLIGASRDVATEGQRSRGRVHFVLCVPNGQLGAMEARLVALGHPLERCDKHGTGCLSICLDDPDGNVVEVTELTTLFGRVSTPH